MRKHGFHTDRKRRALRRHHRQRLIRHARRVLFWMTSEEQVLRWYDNLARCSCWICGNPRRLERRITLQERRLLDAALEDEA